MDQEQLYGYQLEGYNSSPGERQMVSHQDGSNEDKGKEGRFKRYLGENQCYNEARQSSISRVLKMTDLEIFQL